MFHHGFSGLARSHRKSPFSPKPSLPFLAFLLGFSDTFWDVSNLQWLSLDFSCLIWQPLSSIDLLATLLSYFKIRAIVYWNVATVAAEIPIDNYWSVPAWGYNVWYLGIYLSIWLIYDFTYASSLCPSLGCGLADLCQTTTSQGGI